MDTLTVVHATAIVDLVSKVLLLIAGVIGGLWAFVRYVLERGILPAIQFDIELGSVGTQCGMRVVEIRNILKSVGSAPIEIDNFRTEVKFLRASDVPGVYLAGDRKGRLFFPFSAIKDTGKGVSPDVGAATSVDALQEGTVSQGEVSKQIVGNRSLYTRQRKKSTRGVQLLTYKTFVLPGVAQTYPYATVVPDEATFILVWSSFDYVFARKRIRRIILRFAEWVGIIQYPLNIFSADHTSERVFNVFRMSKDGMPTQQAP